MAFIRDEAPADAGAREALLDRVFGPERFQKTCERLREGRLPAAGLSLVAEADGVVVGTVRLWHVQAGDQPALMLGPLGVDCAEQGRGIGAALMRAALDRAGALGHSAVILVGDAPYYERFGFTARSAAGLDLPGAFLRERLLGIELVPGALDQAEGIVRPTGVVPLRASTRGGADEFERHAA